MNHSLFRMGGAHTSAHRLLCYTTAHSPLELVSQEAASRFTYNDFIGLEGFLIWNAREHFEVCWHNEVPKSEW